MDSTDPALIVVTTTAENESAGCLVGFHGQSSIAPHDYCVWLSKANRTYRVGRAAYPLEACPNRITVRRKALLDAGGDHVCLTTRVVSAHTGGGAAPE